MVHYVTLLSSLAQRLANGEGRHALSDVLAHRTYKECHSIISFYNNPSIAPEAHKHALHVMINIPQTLYIMTKKQSSQMFGILFLSPYFKKSSEGIKLSRMCTSLIVSNEMTSLTTLELILAADVILRYTNESTQSQDPSGIPFNTFTTDSSSSSFFNIPKISLGQRTGRNKDEFPSGGDIRLAIKLLTEAVRRIPNDYICNEGSSSEGIMPWDLKKRKSSLNKILTLSTTSSLHEEELKFLMVSISKLQTITNIMHLYGVNEQNNFEEIKKFILLPVAKVLPRIPFLIHLPLILKTRPLHDHEISFLVNILIINEKTFSDIGAQMFRTLFELLKPSNFFIAFTAEKALGKFNLLLHNFPIYRLFQSNDIVLNMFEALAPLLETQIFFTKDFPEGVDFGMKHPHIFLRMVMFLFTVYSTFCVKPFVDQTVFSHNLCILERLTKKLFMRLEEAKCDGLVSAYMKVNKTPVEVYLLQILIKMYRARKLASSLFVSNHELRTISFTTEELISSIKTKSNSLILLFKEESKLKTESLRQQTYELLKTQDKFKIWGDMVDFCLEILETDGPAEDASSSSNMEFYIQVLRSIVFVMHYRKDYHFILKNLHIIFRSLNKAYSGRCSVHTERLNSGFTKKGSTETDALKELLIESFNELRNYIEQYTNVSMSDRKEMFLDDLMKDSLIPFSRFCLSIAMETIQLSFNLGFPISDLCSVPTLESVLIFVLRLNVGRGAVTDPSERHQETSILLLLINGILQVGLNSENLLAAIVTALRGVTFEDTSNLDLSKIISMVRTLSSILLTAVQHLGISSGHRQISQQCLVIVTRLCVLNPPTNKEQEKGNKINSEKLLMQMSFAEIVWNCAMIMMRSSLQYSLIDKHLAVMLRHVRRHWMHPILKSLPPPKSMDEIIFLEKVLNTTANKNSDFRQSFNLPPPSIGRNENGEVFGSHAFLIYANISMLGFIRKLRFMLMETSKKNIDTKKTRIKRYYDVCNVFSEIFEHNKNYMTPSVIYSAFNEAFFFSSFFRKSGYYTPIMQRQLEFCLLCTLSYVEACDNQGSWAKSYTGAENTKSLDKGGGKEVVPSMEASETTVKKKNY
ncbi:unnamed protein product [Phytomonas sp. Hart1]|nr:unnamed protein product [Phytomonas sp. Hart1]|eukprot:CCW69969.1 unnamed protein product [Phytomonas sp. isolate Hart1]